MTGRKVTCDMVKSYEAVYDHGELKWIGDQPPDGRMKVIVTVVEEETRSEQPTVREIWDRAKGCVKPPRSAEEIDSDLRTMRDEWTREWDR